jgi:hypothetical protein
MIGNTDTESEDTMTRLPGYAIHADGDGCTGERRALSGPDIRAIQHELRHLLTATAAQDYDTAARRGGGVALHYGPEGEWTLCNLLAEHIRRGTSQAIRDPRNVPCIALSVPAGDPEALALLSVLAIHHRQRATFTQQCEALEAARLPLQTFLLHVNATDHAAARRHWENTFLHTDGALPLTALGFTAQLVLWAARTLAPRQPAAQTR